MTPIKRRYLPPSGEKKISSWVPILIIVGIFLVIMVGTRYGVRGYAYFQIAALGEGIDEDGINIQQTRFSCVPCSIATLLRDEGIAASVAQLAWMSGTDLDGTNPEGIVAVGETYGFEVTETEMGFDELKEANLPALVFFTWEGSLHAVYVKPESRREYLTVKNPAMGLTMVYKNGVQEYFGSDWWTVFLFE